MIARQITGNPRAACLRMQHEPPGVRHGSAIVRAAVAAREPAEYSFLAGPARARLAHATHRKSFDRWALQVAIPDSFLFGKSKNISALAARAAAFHGRDCKPTQRRSFGIKWIFIENGAPGTIRTSD